MSQRVMCLASLLASFVGAQEFPDTLHMLMELSEEQEPGRQPVLMIFTAD